MNRGTAFFFEREKEETFFSFLFGPHPVPLSFLAQNAFVQISGREKTLGIELKENKCVCVDNRKEIGYVNVNIVGYEQQ